MIGRDLLLFGIFFAAAFVHPNRSLGAGKETKKFKAESSNEKTKSESHASEPKVTKWGVGSSIGVMYFGFGYGVEGWNSFGKNLQVGPQLLKVHGKIKTQGNELLDETMYTDMTQINLRSRYFLSETFYLSGGLAYSLFSGSYGFTIKSNNQEYTTPVSGSALSILASVGNQWRWSNGLVLGCDWVGATAYLNTALTVDAFEDKNVSEAVKAATQSSPETKGGNGLARQAISILQAYIGYQF